MTPESTPFRLTRLRIKNFRSIREADIPLGPLTVLVGPNGSGKSNVLDALRFMRDALTHGLDQALLDRGGLRLLQHSSINTLTPAVSLGVTIVLSLDCEVSYDFTLTPDDARGFIVQREELGISNRELLPMRLIREGNSLVLHYDENICSLYEREHRLVISPGRLLGLQGLSQALYRFDILQSPVLRQVIDIVTSDASNYSELAIMLQYQLKSCYFYALNPSDLRAPQRLVRETPFEENGQNLAAVLRKIRRDPFVSGEVLLVLQRLLQDVADFSIETAGSYLVTNLHYGSAEGGKPRLADLGQESDGTIRTLGILAALYQMPGQALMAFEEPETAIHPGMLAVLAELFVVTSERSQILLTTHSPELLDYLPPESFLVVEKVNGETLVGPLADYQRETIRQKLFTPGEILRSEGLHRDEPLPTE